MFGIGWSEMILISVVALIVVGPADLPPMLRQLGRMVAKAQGLKAELSRALHDAAEDSGVRDTLADLRDSTSPTALGLDGLRGAVDRFEAWEPWGDLSTQPPPISTPLPPETPTLPILPVNTTPSTPSATSARPTPPVRRRVDTPLAPKPRPKPRTRTTPRRRS